VEKEFETKKIKFEIKKDDFLPYADNPETF
jgi:hypothetical protein